MHTYIFTYVTIPKYIVINFYFVYFMSIKVIEKEMKLSISS